jgi:hypothetical protein
MCHPVVSSYVWGNGGTALLFLTLAVDAGMGSTSCFLPFHHAERAGKTPEVLATVEKKNTFYFLELNLVDPANS